MVIISKKLNKNGMKGGFKDNGFEFSRTKERLPFV